MAQTRPAAVLQSRWHKERCGPSTSSVRKVAHDHRWLEIGRVVSRETGSSGVPATGFGAALRYSMPLTHGIPIRCISSLAATLYVDENHGPPESFGCGPQSASAASRRASFASACALGPRAPAFPVQLALSLSKHPRSGLQLACCPFRLSNFSDPALSRQPIVAVRLHIRQSGPPGRWGKPSAPLVACSNIWLRNTSSVSLRHSGTLIPFTIPNSEDGPPITAKPLLHAVLFADEVYACANADGILAADATERATAKNSFAYDPPKWYPRAKSLPV